MAHFVLDKLCLFPPFEYGRIRLVSLYTNLILIFQLVQSINFVSLSKNLILYPDLVERLRKSEEKISELIDRVARLELELANNTFQSNATISSATQTHLAPHDDNLDDDGLGTGLKMLANGGIPPPPPPPPPVLEDFKFASTPNPVFLSRGKLHHKATKGSIPLETSEKEEMDSFMKRKKQRLLVDELIQQKKQLRKMANSGQTPIRATNGLNKSTNGNHSIEEEEGSLNAMMKNALKRKFANVNDISSHNESLISQENSYSEFSL